DDGNPCTINACGGFLGLTCVVVAPASAGLRCDTTDGNFCTLGRCDGAGFCAGDGTTPCDDGEECTTDTCTSFSGGTSGFSCSYQTRPDGAECGRWCNLGSCSGGTCMEQTPGRSCADPNPCTVDTCDESARRCVHTNSSGGSCNDGNSCTTSDQCQDGTCKGLPVICPDDGNKCTTAVCDPSGPSPVCNHLPSVLCRPDGNPCTEDNCNPLPGACHTPLPDGSACDDHIDCTQGDACLAGVCTGTPAPCPDDGNVC